MTITEAVTICLREKYIGFSGRATRSEYWWFGLATLLFTLALTALFFVLNGVSGGFSRASGLSSMGLLVLVLAGIGYLLLLPPTIAVTVRRFHDYNLSGWWVLAGMVVSALPLIGWIATIAMLFVSLQKGTDGENRFGANPLTQI